MRNKLEPKSYEAMQSGLDLTVGQEHTLLSVAIEAIRRYVPLSYDVRCMAGVGSDPHCLEREVPYLASWVEAGGREPRVLRVPCPEHPGCLFILLHEVGHVANRDGENAPRDKERRASEWARRYMESRGVLVPPEVWARAMDLAQQAEADPLGRHF